MNLDDRARRAVDRLHREIDEPAGLEADPLDRFERSLSRKTRNQRLGAVLVAGALTVLGVVFAVRALGPEGSSAPAAPLPRGTLLYGQWDQRQQRRDGSRSHPMARTAPTSTCSRAARCGSRTASGS